MMGVTSDASRTLPRHQKFDQLRMAAMELDAIGGNFSKQGNSGVGIFVFLLSKGDQKFGIPRLGQEFSFPFWVGEIFEALWLIGFAHQLSVPCRHQSIKASRHP